ncbi:MAG: S41 family peptidase [Bacteroidales bacterium]|nr:S41 family peptidase [Bacteroidales bacterium]
MQTRKLSIFILASTVVAVSCGPRMYSSLNRVADEPADGGSYTEKVVPVVTKIAPDSQVTLRFYDDMPDVAYISAADFQSIVLPGSTMTVTKTGAGEYTLANGDATATININNDVFVSDQFEAFTNQMGLLQPGMANVYYDGMPFVRYKSVTYFPATVTTTLDFGAYGIDIRSDGHGTVYFPFATLADMYTDLFYHHAGFNGEKVVANLSVNEVDLDEIDPDYNKPLIARTTRPADLAEFSYKELCFAMDHFYGYPGRIQYNDALKAKGLDKVLEEDIECGPAIKKFLLSEKLTDYFVGMTGLTAIYFDGHTAMDITSALGKAEDHPALVSEFQKTVMANQGIIALLMSAIAQMQEMAADQQAVATLRPRAYGSATYVKKGDTAVCVFDSFHSRNEKAWKDYYAGNGPLPTVDNTENDDMIIFLDALNKANADPEVKNLIIDISKNGGGSADIVMAMTSLIMDKSYISQDNSLTGQRAIVEYEVDRNFNGVFDAADANVRYDLNFAVLTSGTSFSCGNMFPSMLKDAGIPVIGETSGGGACAIQAMCTADGFCFQISSFRARLNSLAGENIDSGIVPDYPIAVEGTVDVPVSGTDTLTVKDYSKYFDIDYLKELLEEGK